MNVARSTGCVLLCVWSLLLVGVLPLSASAVPAPGGDTASTHRTAIDDFLENQVSRHNIPGLSVAVIEEGRVTYSQGYGEAAPDRPMTATTPQPIASMTKPFTAVVVLQLVDQGLLELDAPVQRHLPWFEVSDPEVSAAITVRHLLEHTSGLSDHGYRRLLDPGTSLEEGVRDLRDAEPTAEPGADYQYFNPNYQVLALLVQEVTGRPFSEVVADRILEPLGMSASTLDPAADTDPLAQGFTKVFGFAIPRDAPVRRYRDGADNLVSTSEDLARFAVAAGLPSGDSTRLLSPQSREAMQNPTGGLGYGLGWQVWEEAGERVAGHDGLDPTYSGQMVVLPEQDSGFVLLMNQGHLVDDMVVTPQLRAGMLDLLAGRDAQGEGLAARTVGWILLAVFAVVAFFSVRSLLRLRTWPQRRTELSRRRKAWEIGSHLLSAGLLLAVMYVVLPMLLGRAFNLAEVGLYHLPDVTLIVAISVLADLAAGTVMLLMTLGHRRWESRTRGHGKQSRTPVVSASRDS